MNRVQLIGWLGKDPEIITTKNGTIVARLRLATDVFVFQKEAPPKKFTTWHTVRMWKSAQIEYYRHYLVKGSHVLVDGRIEYREYKNKRGEHYTIAEIVANFLVDLDR